MIASGVRRIGSRFGRPGAHAVAELGDLALLGPRRFVQQRRSTPLRTTIRAEWYRRLWTEAAARIDAEIVEGPGALLRVERNGRSTRLWGHFVAADDPVTLRLVGDKPAAHQLLTAHGLRVPEHAVFDLDHTSRALDFVERHEAVVVKPAAATGAGAGVTGGVRNARTLERALLRTAPHDTRRVLIEEQVTGRELRVLVVHGEPLAVVERRRPEVTGDGHRTIGELVDAETRRRVDARGDAGLFPLELDLDAALALAARGHRFSSVPVAGDAVTVKNSTSQGGDRDATARAIDDPGLAGVVVDATAAARALGTSFASVEFLTPDPSVRTADAGVVLEVNTTPGIAQHHLVDNPSHAPDVAALVLDRLLTESR